MLICLSKISCNINVEQVCARLHLPMDSDDAGEISELVKRAQPIVQPKALLCEAFITNRGQDTVTVENSTFTSRVMCGNFADIERVFPFVATCGVELDSLLNKNDDEFIRYSLDCIKEVALGAAINFAREYVVTHFGLTHLASMSPGSGDADIWRIEQQIPLFALLGDVEGQIGVRLTDSCLMCPNKTISGIYFPTEVNYIACQLCHRADCPNRHAPFDEHQWLEKHAGAEVKSKP